MMIAPSQMPDYSRVWVYQCNRKFSADEEKNLSDKATDFVSAWTAHNAQLRASFEIRYNRFLIFMIDEMEAQASGCSIDKSLHFVQQMETEMKISMLDRMLLAYKEDDEVIVVSKNDFEKLLREGKITDSTIVFNNLVQTKHELDVRWEITFGKSWFRQIFSALV